MLRAPLANAPALSISPGHPQNPPPIVSNRCKIRQNAQIVGLDWGRSRLYDAWRPCTGADVNAIADGHLMTRFAPVPARSVPAAPLRGGPPLRMADDKRKSGEGGP